MSPQPIIFISAVSKELNTAREAVAQVLRTLGYAVDYQPDFGTEHGDIREMLRRRIEPCEGVIQLVGQRYGFEPPVADETHGRVSYTQYEALHARSLPKKVWYLILDTAFHSDTQEPQTSKEAELQQAYRNRVLKDTHVYHHIPDITSLKLKVHEMKNELELLRKDWQQHRERLESGLGRMEQMLVEQTAPGRLAAYKRSLLSAFRPYQELAIDNFAAAEQAAPDIWDIFVHPACSEKHLRPEDMDTAQRETPPRLPAQDLLPLLARDDHRRTVLLADPGMGKSTLIQSLIAHLISGRPLSGAPALTGLLPVPLILRDLVPLLPQDQVAGWSWDDLLTVLIEHYQREETSPPLCDCFKDHRDEFRQLIHTDAKVFFLIDGLDEIGNLAKRRQIVHCIQDGIRAVNKEARWLITSRMIGYEDAPVELIKLSTDVRSDPVGNMSSAHGSMSQLFDRWHQKDLQWLAAHTAVMNLYDDELTQGMLHERYLSVLQKPGEMDGEMKMHRHFVFSIAQRLHLAPFDDKRQDLFTQRWFQYRHSTDYSRELMREVRAHHHDGVRIISRVPNLLCMMNILKRSGKPLPDGRAALYDEIVKAYLVGIDSAYRLRPVLGNTCPFDAHQRRFLLSLLGAHMQQTRTVKSDNRIQDADDVSDEQCAESEGNILISRPDLEQLLSPAIQRMRDEHRVISDHTSAELLDELLHHIASRSGLLIPRSSDVDGNTLYSFTHLSFLEFFAAEWLGMDFDRQRNRIVRRTLALEENHTLSEIDLDREFPPQGPIQHPRETFKTLHGFSAWHEPLIFLLESRKADTPTLLRWLFPALHPTNREPRTENRELTSPRLPIATVQLVVKLAQDPEIPLSAATRQGWWRILWSAYLACRHAPSGYPIEGRWPIAPLLLGSSVNRSEVLQALVDIYPKEEERPPNSRPPRLHLCNCRELTSEDLNQIARLTTLRSLDLLCCSGLVDTQPLGSLSHLECLDLSSCTGLQGREALRGITKLKNLQTLLLNRCTGLTKEDVAWLREKLGNKCTIFGP